MAQVSVVVSTIRPQDWPRFCAHLATNDVDLEVIFVGPITTADAADLQLPFSVTCVSTSANPALCWEIGSRLATSDLLCLSCDDMCYSEHFFDDVVALAKLTRNHEDMFAARYLLNGGDQLPTQMFLGLRQMPLVPIDGVYFTEAHHRIGGIDKRFKAVLWDCDLYMRLFLAGGRCTLLPAHTCTEVGAASTMWSRFANHDRAILEELWFRDGVVTFERNRPPEPYGNEAGPCRNSA